jgi:hypothetical protein
MNLLEIEFNAKLQALTNQRNNAQNECVTIFSQLTLAHSRIQALEKEIETMRKPKKKKLKSDTLGEQG